MTNNDNKKKNKKHVTEALLGPSAELLGRHLRQFLQKKIEQWKEQNCEKNLNRLLVQVLKG
jgi:hypothetical protein